MAKLINGNGNPAIYAAEDADLIASLAGNVTCIANVGNKYAATEEDATTIRLDDGVIITKEGRRIQLEAGESDTFYIPTGTSGQTNYYIIGYKLVQNADSTQVAEQFVQKMNSSTATITEDTFRGGATEVYVSLYRVTQVDFAISDIDALLPKLSDLTNKPSVNGVLINGYDFTDVSPMAIGGISNLYSLNNNDTSLYTGSPSGWSGGGYMFDFTFADWVGVRFLFDNVKNKIYMNSFWYSAWIGWKELSFDIGRIDAIVEGFNDANTGWHQGSQSITLEEGNYVLMMTLIKGTGASISLAGISYTDPTEFFEIPAVNNFEHSYIMNIGAGGRTIYPYIYGSGECELYLTTVKVR